MSRLYFLVSFTVLALVCHAATAFEIAFDHPLSKVSIPIPKKAEPWIRRQFSCSNYGRFAVTEVNDGDVGAAEITIRYREKNSDLCRKEFTGRERKLDLNMLSQGNPVDFAGVKEDFLMIEEAEGFGDEQKFAFVKSSDGKKIFEDKRSTSNELTFTTESGHLGIEFYKLLRVSCPLVKVGASCWAQVLKDNQVPISLGITEPDCAKVYKEEKVVDLDDPPQISVPVKVANLDAPGVVYLKGVTHCHATP